MTSVLVAGIGNVFLGDDGFGVEVVHRLRHERLPDGVVLADYGIRGVHLAYELLDRRFDTVIMVDAVPLDGPPGTVAVLDADLDAARVSRVPADAHGMDPVAVLSLVRALGGTVDRVLVVGCRPAVLDERMELSGVVRAAVDEAARLVLDLVRTEITGRSTWTPSSC